MKLIGVSVAAMLAALVATPAAAQTKVTIAISGWTGFAPLTLAHRPSFSSGYSITPGATTGEPMISPFSSAGAM